MKCGSVSIISQAEYRFIFLKVFSGGLKKYPSLNLLLHDQLSHALPDVKL